jgi:ribosomal protein S27E
MSVDQRRRTVVDRHAFLAYAVQCPFCGTNVGPRFVTREHLDVPPNPPYAATVRCPNCKEIFEVQFSDAPR